MKLVAIDFETANSSSASVCALGVSSLEDGVIEEEINTLIQPEDNVSKFSYWNVKIHGILPEDVVNAPRWQEVYKQLLEVLDGDTIVCAHNASFDMACLKATCANTGLRLPYLRYFDTVQISRKAFPELVRHRLNDMCDYLSIDLNHHNAASDALGCLLIVERLMDRDNIYDVEELLAKYGMKIHEL